NLEIKQTRIRLALINGKNSFDKNQTTQWITQMAQAVASIGDEFPIKDLQVMVIFMRGAQEVVSWGQVNRAGASGVLFVTNPDASKAELMSDWTAAHEFSHLLLPYTPSDRWLSEGFASYHQNISRAKAGLIDEKTTWEKLLSGFARGKKTAQSLDAPKLKQADQKHNMQMYWGGAVIALKADVALQELSGGHFDLSKAISHLKDCCLETGRAWTAKETFEQLDLISNSKIFSRLYHSDVKTNRFPEYQQLLKDLGITNSRYGGIQLNDQAKKAKIRKKIISQKSR
ncbi:MAG: hypothetical protein L3J52_07485, partial [Proteobacteria bacterium]|nr:hypothetical protein [Pseudomonadota bacterium]